MDQGPLVTEQLDAGLTFLGEYEKKFPVQVAFWIKNVEGKWRLYVASEKISDSNFTLGYKEVVRITHEHPDPWLDPFQIRVIGADDLLAKAALDAIQQTPKPMYKRLRQTKFGTEFVEEICIYPLLNTWDLNGSSRQV